MTIQKLFILVITVLLLLPATVAAQEPQALAQKGGAWTEELRSLTFLEQAFSPIRFAPGIFGCNKPHDAGATEYFIESGGLQRRFLLHVPPSYNGLYKIPVVFDIHGSTSFPEQELLISGLDVLADAEDFAVVAPEGIDGFWNVPVDPAKQDDVQFISDIIDVVDEVLCLNQNRVYVAGFSGGGRMASQVACDLSDRIAAFGPVGGVRFPAPCQGAVPVITFHGTADPINPYEGGGPAYWQTGVEQAIQGWTDQNGCYAEPFERQISESVTKVKYIGCGRDGDVELYRIEGMGHQWPGSAIDIGSDTFGPPNSEIDATSSMWQFFRRHRLH
jgi:polyhydroxybutyrate depolymerase